MTCPTRYEVGVLPTTLTRVSQIHLMSSVVVHYVRSKFVPTENYLSDVVKGCSPVLRTTYQNIGKPLLQLLHDLFVKD